MLFKSHTQSLSPLCLIKAFYIDFCLSPVIWPPPGSQWPAVTPTWVLWTLSWFLPGHLLLFVLFLTVVLGEHSDGRSGWRVNVPLWKGEVIAVCLPSCLSVSGLTEPNLSTCLSPQNDSPAMKKAVSLLSLTTPNSNRKRRRLKDTLAQLTKETEISPFPPPRKRPSAEHNLSVLSLLDISNTPDTCKALTGRL